MAKGEGRFDLIVLGGGPAGEHAVGRARAKGLSVALVEVALVGGECSYFACMPSKTLLRPGAVLAAARGVPGARQAIQGALDVSAALARRDWMTADWDDASQQQWVESLGATLVRGKGRLVGERRVEVQHGDETSILVAEKAVVLATGSRSIEPPIEGLASARHWDNRGATAAKSVPRSLVVLGGGVVGVELAQAFRRLGTDRVTVVEGGDRLVATSEPFASEILQQAFASEGIVVITGTRAIKASRPSEESPITLTLDGGREVQGDELLVAVGRRPNSEDIGLELFGLKGRGAVEVDASMRVLGVGGGWLFAIGDLNGRAPLTHMGKYHARVAIDTITGLPVNATGPTSGVVFTDPAIASVGLTEQSARAAGHDVVAVRVALNSVAAAEIAGEEIVGACQLVIDQANEVVLGATFVGPDIAEAIHAATIAIAAEIPLTRLRHAVPAFPTYAEVWLELIDRALAS